jgi:DNA repair protein RadD
MFKLRPYQQEAVDSAMFYMTQSRNKKPSLLVLPTGAGKSLVIADVAKQLNEPLLIFQPTKEILEQNYNKLIDYGIMGVGVYSASAGRKEINNITLATIGSVFRKPDDFKQFKNIIIDECHLVNSKGGMYKSFVDVVGEKMIGLTATPYRLAHNSFGSTLRFLTRTNPRVFGKVIHVTQTEELSKMGFLSKNEYFDVNGFNRKDVKVNSTGADYVDESLQTYYTKIEFNKQVVKVVNRLLEIGRKKILVFTKFVEEAEELSFKLGDCCKVVHGEMKSKERSEVIDSFRKGDTKVVTNVGVLTLGFDFPELDTVVLARPTRSLTLYYQMIGRVVRPHPSKDHSMIVDLCGNYKVFGRIEDLRMVEYNDNMWYVESKGKKLTNVYLDEIQNL